MQQNLTLPLKFRYESDMLASYAMLEFDGGIDPSKHQTEMIAQNPSTGFIPFSIRREDEKVRIYYNITSKLPLSQHLSRKTLSKGEFLDLLRSINRNIMSYVNYYLDISGFVLDEDFMYINPSTGDTSLIYVPLPLERDFVKDYKSLITNLIVNTVNLDDNTSDNFLQKLLSYLKMEQFNLKDFNKLLTDLKSSCTERVYAGNSAYTEVEGSVKEKAPSEYAFSVSTHAEHEIKPSIIFVQAVFILALAALCLFLVLKRNADVETVAGVAIIAAALDALFLSKIASKDRGDTLIEERKVGKKDKHQGKQNADRPLKAKAAVKPDAAINRCSGRQLSDDYIKAYDTVVIGSNTGMLPSLNGIGAQSAERIVISKDRFVIGRLKSYVDYIIDCNLVGKVHAEITRKGNSCFIKDLNSKNGTYINGEKIPSNEEHEIKDNDRVRFANIEYIFRA